MIINNLLTTSYNPSQSIIPSKHQLSFYYLPHINIIMSEKKGEEKGGFISEDRKKMGSYYNFGMD